MADRKTLVVYYSRSGHTEAVSREIARQSGAEIEAIDAGLFAHGFLWFLRAAWSSLTSGEVKIAQPKFDPRDFDLVVLATPVWVGRPSSPMRAYLRDHATALPAIACVMTHGAGDPSQAFEKFEALAGKAPVARVSLSDVERKSGTEPAKILDFVATLTPPSRADAA